MAAPWKARPAPPWAPSLWALHVQEGRKSGGAAHPSSIGAIPFAPPRPHKAPSQTPSCPSPPRTAFRLLGSSWLRPPCLLRPRPLITQEDLFLAQIWLVPGCTSWVFPHPIGCKSAAASCRTCAVCLGQGWTRLSGPPRSPGCSLPSPGVHCTCQAAAGGPALFLSNPVLFHCPVISSSSFFRPTSFRKSSLTAPRPGEL